jgi:hypothetical protein
VLFLLQKLRKLEKISTWWEIIVCATIVSKSFSKRNLIPSLNEVFGFDLEKGHKSFFSSYDESIDLTPEFVPQGQTYARLPEPNQGNKLLIFGGKQSGFDAYTAINAANKPRLHFYLQMKIEFHKKKDDGTGSNMPTSEVVAKSLTLTLREHLLRYPDCVPDLDLLRHVHLVIYNWGDGGEPALTKDEVRKRLEVITPSARVAGGSSKEKTLKGFDDIVLGFVDAHFANIHVVDRPSLEKWMIPSFLPFPILFTALGEEMFKK